MLPNVTYGGNIFFLGFYRNSILFDQDINTMQIVEDKIENLFDSSQPMKPKSIVGYFEYEENNPNQMPIGLHLWNITDCDKKTLGKLTSVSTLENGISVLLSVYAYLLKKHTPGTLHRSKPGTVAFPTVTRIEAQLLTSFKKLKSRTRACQRLNLSLS